MLRTHPATKSEHGAMVDGRGYAYCLDCREFDRTQWLEAGSLDGVCDGCGSEFTACTPLEISGTATVEFVKCKVF